MAPASIVHGGQYDTKHGTSSIVDSACGIREGENFRLLT